MYTSDSNASELPPFGDVPELKTVKVEINGSALQKHLDLKSKFNVKTFCNC
jgi:hypothetical protein